MIKSRRDFLKTSLALGLIAPFKLSATASAIAAATSNTNYKAVVFISLVGGNDSLSMLIPNKDESADSNFEEKGYDTYSSQRDNIAVANNVLSLNSYKTGFNLDLDLHGNPYHVDGTSDSAFSKGYFSLDNSDIPYGVNSLMPEIAHLINEGEMSVLSNIGNLVEPITKAQVQAGSKEYPPFLFAHNLQRRVIQTGAAGDIYSNGWAGYVADLWEDSFSDSIYEFGVSYAGTPRLLAGDKSSFLSLSSGEPIVANDYDGALGDVLIDMNTTSEDKPLRNFMGNIIINAKNSFEELNNEWTASTPTYESLDPYGNKLFSTYVESTETELDISLRNELLPQLETVAHMMTLGKSHSLPGQIFYVELNGFDHHSAASSKHPQLMRELSLALYSFNKAMKELGLNDDVVTITTTDFGRTAVQNSDGTDHAWGAQQLIMGGCIQGGKMIGELPSILSGGESDSGTSGRIIPTTSYEQVFAPLVNWLGVGEGELTNIFPNLENFKSSDSLSSAFADIF